MLSIDCNSLKQKLKTFLEQYTVREEHFAKQLEAKDLTVQLAEARLAHQVELTAREAERVKLALAKAQEFSEREVQLQVRPFISLFHSALSCTA